MGFTFVTPTTVGGTVLIIERIESQNYVAGVSGWDIAADGTAEFNNVTVRGSLITGATGSQHIAVNGPNVPQGIAFYTGDANESSPGKIQSQPFTDELTLLQESPSVLGLVPTTVTLGSGKGTTRNRFAVQSQDIILNGAVTATSLNLGLGSTVNDLQFGSGSFTVDATTTGRINIPHTLGVVPTAAFVTFQNSQHLGTADLGLSTTTTIVVIVRNITAAGAILANGTPVVCRYLFII